jgi:hypothetical protein
MTPYVATLLGMSLTIAGAPPSVTGKFYELPDDHAVTTVRRLSGEDLERYSGVGALRCHSDDGSERVVTAFLVGAFDVVVTVAHAFDDTTGTVAPSDCSFVQTDSNGRLVERIGVAEFKSKWIDEPAMRGSPRQDVAVARLERSSGYAQRTLAFKRFDGQTRDVAVVAYQTEVDGTWIKGESRAMAATLRSSGEANVIPQLVWSSVIPQPSASGAPVIDIDTGAVIGINQYPGQTERGTLLVIDEWLASAIRGYANAPDPAGG